MKVRCRSSIRETFSLLRVMKKKALIAFITAGDPSVNATEELIHALKRGGADIIELGIPFSDPMADGPTIQASSERALKNNVTLEEIFDLVKRVRRQEGIPIILFGYYNPIFNYGVERFARDAHDAGVDGLLVVDLPPEESDELQRYTDREGIDLVYLLTPTSNDNRMKLVAEKARGFVYFVSVTGVTGARKSLPREIKGYVEKARKFTKLPIGIGFGISTPEQAALISKWADGIIVGSAIVKIIEKNQGSNKFIEEVEGFVKSLKEAMEKSQSYL